MTRESLIKEAHLNSVSIPAHLANPETAAAMTEAGMAVIRQELVQAACLAANALKLGRRIKDPMSIGAANRLMGHTHLLAGRAKRALRYYDRARDSFANIPEERAATAVAMLQALAYVSAYDRAFEVAGEALYYFQSAGDSFRAARVEANLANALHRLDRLDEARAHYLNASQVILEAGAVADLAIVTRNFGVCLMGLMQLDEAAKLYVDARAVFAEAEQSSLVYEIDLNRAYLLARQGRIRESLALYRDLRRDLPADLGFELGHCFLDQADVMLENGLWSDAGQAAEQARQIFEHLGAQFEWGKAQLFLGLAGTRQGDLDAALVPLRESRRRLRRDPNENWRGLVEFALAEWYRAAGQSKRALKALLAAEALNLAPERKPLVQQELADLALDLGDLEVYQRLPRYSSLEAKAARLRGDLQTAREAARRALKKYDHSRGQMEGSRLRQAIAVANARDLRECFRAFTDPRERLDVVVRLKSQSMAELAAMPEALPAFDTEDELREARNLAVSKSAPTTLPKMPPEHRFVEIFVDAGEVLAFLIEGEDVREMSLGPSADWTRLARNLRFQLGRERGEAGNGARRVIAELGDRLASVMEGAKHVTIGREPPIKSLPIHAAFPSLTVAYAPNATTFAALAHRTPRTTSRLVIGVADDLAPMIAEEADLVARHLGAARAEPADFEGLAPSARIIHLAAHGVAREDRPLLSAMKFGAFDLTAMQILRLPLSADLVTLSGCSTGVSATGDLQESEGFIEAFLIAGANTMLASLWEVSDAATFHFMDHLYGHLSEGFAIAYRRAQESTQAAFPHPADWAAFACFGRTDFSC